MAPRKIGTRPVSQVEARAYFRRAAEFYAALVAELRSGRWNSAALEGVQCAISATDALVGLRAGLRSKSPSHADAADLVRLYVSDPQVKEQSNRFLRILSRKHLVQYESREFHESEARDILRDVDRYLTWIRSFFVR